MESRDQERLKRHLSALTDDLFPMEVIPLLSQEAVLNESDVEVIMGETTRKQQAFKLITILTHKGPRAYGVFLEALKDTHEHLHAMLSLTTDPSPRGLHVLQEELREHYLNTLSILSPIPWCPWFHLNLDEIYTPLRLARGDARNTFTPAVDKCARRESKEVDGCSLFSSDAKNGNCSPPKRILIEGDAGIGKSTLCRKLTYLWSKGKEACDGSCVGTTCVHSYDLVFMVNSMDFCEMESITDVIFSQLLPEDSALSPEILNSILKSRQCKTLFIIDGYDEACDSKIHLLHKIIQGSLLSHTSLLISSRPTYLLQKLKHFDSIFVAMGYDSKLRTQFVEKFAHATDCDIDKFKPLLLKIKEERPVKDLCRNPLNLCILSLLCLQTEEQLPTSRTGIYKAVNEFIMEKAVDRLSSSLSEFESTVLRPMCELAFQTLEKGTGIMTENDFKSLSCDPEVACKAGYINKRLSIVHFRPQLKFSFNHRSFQDFFAARYLLTINSDDRASYLHEHLGTRKHRSCCRFLFGLLDGDEQSLLHFTSIWFERASFTPTDSLPFEDLTTFDLTECHRSHLLMQCLCELQSVPPRVAELLCENCPQQVCFSYPLCTTSCVKGLSIVCDLLKQTSFKLSVVIPAYLIDTKEEEFNALLTQFSKSKVIASVALFNIASLDQLDNVVRLMRVGKENSGVCSLKLRFMGFIQCSLSQPRLALGPYTRGLELHHCISPDVIKFILEALPTQRVRCLVVSQCSVDAACCRIITRLLSAEMCHFSLLHHSLNVTGEREMVTLIENLAASTNLRSLEISHLPMQNPDTQAAMQQLLSQSRLRRLLLMHCYFSPQLCDVVSSSLPLMTELTDFQMSFGLVPEPAAFDPILSALSKLPLLESFSMYEMDPNEHHTAILADLVRSCSKLKSIKVSKLNGNLINDISLALSPESQLQSLSCKKLGFSGRYVSDFAQSIECLPNLAELILSMHPGNYLVDQEHLTLFNSLSRCKHLKKLALRQTGIEDSLAAALCKYVSSADQLVQLDLHHNMLSEESFVQLAQTLEDRPRRLNFLDISDCLVTESSPAVEKLRNLCCFVRINWF